MPKSILLVLDDQPVEHASVEIALRWASEFDALLVGLGVLDETHVNPVEPTPIGAGEAKRQRDAVRLHERQAEIERGLSAIAVRCAQSRVAFKPLEDTGLAAGEIAKEAQRFDLILMARTLDVHVAPNEWHSSETLRTILRLAPRPVVAAADEMPTGNAVAIAYDGSLQAARTLHAFVASGMATGRGVHVASFHEEPIEAAKIGNRAIEFLADHGVRATLFAHATERPVVEILNFARDVQAGMLVLGAYGKPRIQEFFVGSVTSAMLARCALPLFLFH
jgi:nucleotide-binding universal stress UspA family protein